MAESGLDAALAAVAAREYTSDGEDDGVMLSNLAPHRGSRGKAKRSADALQQRAPPTLLDAAIAQASARDQADVGIGGSGGGGGDDDDDGLFLSNVSRDEPARKRRQQGAHRVAEATAPPPAIPQREAPKLELVPLPDAAKEQPALFAQDRFEDMGLDVRLLRALQSEFKIDRPTHIQRHVVPTLLQSTDMVVRSSTGTGKTLGFLLPILQRLLSAQVTRSHGTIALILAPTRELCLQIHDVAERLLRPFPWLVPGHVMGGEKKKAEKARLRKGVTVLVATPGRLLDHMRNTEAFGYRHLQSLVLDEADQLLDMGFEKDLTAVVGLLDKHREKRQSILTSATLTPGVLRLASLSLHNPLRYGFDDDDGSGGDGDEANGHVAGSTRHDPVFNAPDTLKQHFALVPCKHRLTSLVTFLVEQLMFNDRCKVVIFFSSCDSVEYHHALLSHLAEIVKERATLPETRWIKLHGDLPQKTRTAAFLDFCKLERGVLLCTDVAARGLDLPQVSWIVQFDLPISPVDYVHRIGRTARMGQQGSAMLFLLPAEAEFANLLRTHGMDICEYDFQVMAAKVATFMRAPGPEYMAAVFHKMMTVFVSHRSRSKEMEEMAIRAYLSAVRAYGARSTAIKAIMSGKLHLGHFARSFVLAAAPTDIGRLGRKNRKRSAEEEAAAAPRARPANRAALVPRGPGSKAPISKRAALAGSGAATVDSMSLRSARKRAASARLAGLKRIAKDGKQGTQRGGERDMSVFD